MLSVRHLAVGLLIVSCVAVRTADASPIMYLYTGTASADPDIQAFIPPGSPATILLTVDPAVNLVVGDPHFPPDAGLYRFDAVLDFTGREYTLGGFFEVNLPAGSFPEDGVPVQGRETSLVETTPVEGPRLSADLPQGVGYPDPGCGFPVPCLYPQGGAGVPPGALPFFSSLYVPIAFTAEIESPIMFPFREPLDRVTISGSNPQVVPEPSTLLLVGTGLVAVARRRLTRSKHSKVVVHHTC